MKNEPLIASVMNLLPPVDGRDWLTVAIETTDKDAFVASNQRVLAVLAGNIVAHGVSEVEATKAAVSQIIAVRALGCRASAITDEFRPWTRVEKMKAIAAQNVGIRPKEVLEWIGKDAETEKADRKKIYKAQTSDSIGRRWASHSDALPVYLRSAVEYWTTSPDHRIPPMCLLSEGAISRILLSDAVGDESIRQAIHRAGLYRPKGVTFSYDRKHFFARRRL